jgi:tetratricopeptide (TPR) repeat protein
LKRSVVFWLSVATTLASSALAQPAKAPARAAYVRGKAAYEQGEYGEALRHFEEAYRASRAPALLFNMAQAHRLSGSDHCQPALELYRQYLAEDPEASNREEAAERVGEMRACVERKRAETPAVSAPSEELEVTSPPVSSGASRSERRAREQPATAGLSPGPRDERQETSPTAGIVLTGAGATLGVAGAILYLRARAKYAEAEESCPCEPGTFSTWETLTHVSYGLMAAGVLGTGSGVSWLLLRGDGSEPHKISGVLVRGAARF